MAHMRIPELGFHHEEGGSVVVHGWGLLWCLYRKKALNLNHPTSDPDRATVSIMATCRGL